MNEEDSIELSNSPPSNKNDQNNKKQLNVDHQLLAADEYAEEIIAHDRCSDNLKKCFNHETTSNEFNSPII